MFSLGKWATAKVTEWLSYEPDLASDIPPATNYQRLCDEIRPGDIILVEGRSRVSDIIKQITQSSWTHSALYLGNYHQLNVAGIAPAELAHYASTPHTELVIEALLGQGTIVTPLSKYRNDHLRICRPRSLTISDRNTVIQHCLAKLGYQYDIRQLFDLTRFMMPYSFIPHRWRSSLFNYHAGQSTRTICSSMLAEGFMAVHYPILPVIQHTEQGVRFYNRNAKLFTPKDFDYSPYFDIIKYPVFGLDDVAAYRSLPWDKEGYICNERGDCVIPENDIVLAETESDNKPTVKQGG